MNMTKNPKRTTAKVATNKTKKAVPNGRGAPIELGWIQPPVGERVGKRLSDDFPVCVAGKQLAVLGLAWVASEPAPHRLVGHAGSVDTDFRGDVATRAISLQWPR
jgi:hypothetical protein